MSKIEVNTIEPQCGTNLTLGANNDTISLGTGAGFTGGIDAVKWETTPQTGNFQATAGRGYFMNTTSGALQLTTPASPSAGDIFAVADYARTFATYNLTIAPHAGAKIGGVAANATLNVDGQAATFVYIDATQGWINVQETQSSQTGQTFISATGGTITTVCTDFKVHTFTGPGTFCVSSISNNPANNEVSYTVIAGGAGGGGFGGGGAGGFRENKSGVDTYTASPLNGATPITVTATAFPIQVGGGGAGATRGCSGSNSIFSTITSAGGGGGGGFSTPSSAGNPGGSGGGGGSPTSAPYPGQPGGTGNTPPVSPAQGTNGGSGVTGAAAAGGGGGATTAGIGGSCTPAPNVGGNGGTGATTSINGTPTAFAGGGGAGGGTKGTGGTGGGGDGSPSAGCQQTAGTTNTGGGGGGDYAGTGAAGGSGIVIIRYKYQ